MIRDTSCIFQTPDVHCRHQTSTADTRRPLQTPDVHCRHQTSTADTRHLLQTPYVHCRHQTSTADTIRSLQTPDVHCRHQTSTADTRRPLQTPDVHCRHQMSMAYCLTFLKCVTDSGLAAHISSTSPTAPTNTPWFLSARRGRVIGTNISIKSGTFRIILK